MLKYLIRKFDSWWLGQIDIGRIDKGTWLFINPEWHNLDCDLEFYIGADYAKSGEDFTVFHPKQNEIWDEIKITPE